MTASMTSGESSMGGSTGLLSTSTEPTPTTTDGATTGGTTTGGTTTDGTTTDGTPTGGTTNGTSDTTAPACDGPVDCPVAVPACRAAECIDGACIFMDMPDGTLLPDQAAPGPNSISSG